MTTTSSRTASLLISPSCFLGAVFQDISGSKEVEKSAGRIFNLQDRKSEIDPISREGITFGQLSFRGIPWDAKVDVFAYECARSHAGSTMASHNVNDDRSNGNEYYEN